MTYTLTAADYVYLDKAETRYMEVKELIASHRVVPEPDATRPRIPGTLKVLNAQVLELVGVHGFTAAAQLIESKVRAAYKVPAITP